MPWKLNYHLLLPCNIVRTFIFVSLNKSNIRVTESHDGNIQFRPLEHILVTRHPLGCLTKGEIRFEDINPDETKIHIILYPHSLRLFAGLFPVIFIPFITLFGHWVTNIPLKDVFIGLWIAHISILAGAILIYLLLKQTVIVYFDRLVEKTNRL